MVEARRTPPRRIDIRQIDSNSARMVGYATIYGHEYDVAGGPDEGGFREVIAPGAAKRSVRNIAAVNDREDRDDVRLLINHDGMPLARTRSRTLILESDGTGLVADAELDLRSSAARDAVIAMERGDMDEMSFAFRVLDQEWNTDYTHRTIREVKLYDVSLVTYPANPAASAYLQSEIARGADIPALRTMSLVLAQAEAEALVLRR